MSGDVTLALSSSQDKKYRAQRLRAWARFAGPGCLCPFCPHDLSGHVLTFGQPHFYREASAEELADPARYRLSLVILDQVEPVAGRRVVVANGVEVLEAFCLTCADEKETHQVVCYLRTLAKGELVGPAQSCPGGDRAAAHPEPPPDGRLPMEGEPTLPQTSYNSGRPQVAGAPINGGGNSGAGKVFGDVLTDR